MAHTSDDFDNLVAEAEMEEEQQPPSDDDDETDLDCVAPARPTSRRPKKKKKSYTPPPVADHTHDRTSEHLSDQVAVQCTQLLGTILARHEGVDAVQKVELMGGRDFYNATLSHSHQVPHSVTYMVRRLEQSVCGHDNTLPAGHFTSVTLIYPPGQTSIVRVACTSSPECDPNCIKPDFDRENYQSGYKTLEIDSPETRKAVQAWRSFEEHLDSPGGECGYDEGCNVDHPTVRDFNKHHFMLNNGSTYISIHPVTRRITTYSKQHLINRFEHFAEVEVDIDGKKKSVPFISCWLKSRNKRRYARIENVPPPLDCRNDVYNLWTPFAGQVLLDEGIEPDESSIEVIRAHLKVMVSHKQDQLIHIIAFFAQIAQFPGTMPGVALIMRSKPGSGKGLTMSLQHNWIGHDKSSTTSRLEDVFGKYNEMQQKSLFIDLDDFDTADMYKYQSDMLHAITDGYKGTTIRRMCMAPEPNVKCYARYAAKGQGIGCLQEDQRRFFVTDVSNEKCGDMEYFAKIDELFNRPSVIAAWFKYLKEFDLSGINLRDMPITESSLAMQGVNVPAHVRLLHQIARGPQPAEQQQRTKYPTPQSIREQQLQEHNEVEITSDKFSTLHEDFWAKYYSSRDKASAAMNNRTLSIKVIELTKDVVYRTDERKEKIDGVEQTVKERVAVESGIRTCHINVAPEGAKRQQLRGFRIDCNQLLQYMKQRYKLSEDRDNDLDIMCLEGLPDFQWSSLRAKAN
jgi:hypothetical protein